MGSRTAAGKRGPVIRVFFLAFVVYAYFMPRWADWNIDSRLDLVHAIVDGHTLRIDKYHWNTWDKAYFPSSNGHFYSDKAPGTALLGAGVYALFVGARQLPGLGGGIQALERNSAWNVAISLGKTSTQAAPAPKGTILGGCQRTGTVGNVQYIPWGNRLVPPERDWALSKYVITVGVDGLLSALFVAFFFWFLGVFATRMLYRWILTLLYAFATVALPYSTVFYSHQLVAGFLFTAFALLYLLKKGKVRAWAAPAAGFLLGFSLLTEYTVAIIIAVIVIYGLCILRRSAGRVAGLAVSALVPVGILFAYNQACFGNGLDTGYSHDWCWSSAQGAGIAGFTYPHLDALYDLTFGSYRGLLYMSPFLLLAIPGAVFMWRRALRSEVAVCGMVSITFVLALSAYWGWNGGKVEGPRYLVPMAPFAALPVAFFLERMRNSLAGWMVVSGTAAWSIFAVWVQFLGGLLFPISWLRNPISEYSWPMLRANQIAPNAGLFLGLSGWVSLLPLLVLIAGVLVWPASPQVRKRARAPSGSRPVSEP